MTLLKNLSKSSLAAIALSLFSAFGVRAADVAFDNGSSLTDSVQALRERSKGNTDLRSPVPSTFTSSNELTGFWDNLKEGGIDKLCKSAQIKVNEEAVIADVVGIGGGLKRYFKAYPDQRLALIDEIELKLSASIGTEVLQIPNVGSLSVGISGGVEGRSVVVRPLDNNRYCRELGTLVKLYDVKTVLPITAKRIGKMEKGEIWKLPVVVRYSISGGIGATVGQAVTISIGGGMTKERKPSMSLYKIDDNNLRLRLRIDHVTIKSVGISAGTVEIPAGDIGLMRGESQLAGVVNNTLAGQINKFIAFKLGYSHVRTRGQKLLLEFYIDPNNKEQVARLVEFLEGDLDTIKKFISMGLRFDTFAEDASGRAGMGDIEEMSAQAGSALNANSTFAGSDHYSGHSDNFNITIPILHSHQKSWASVYHRYQSLNDSGSTLHVQQETRVSNGDSMNIPFSGTLIKSNSQKNVYVVNKEVSSGEVSRPVMMYQQYEGFMRRDDAGAREMIDKANGVLKYAGTQGNGVNTENTLPPAGIFPPLPAREPDYNYDNPRPEPSKTYRAAVMSFKLVFAEKAVQDIIFAPAQMILKSFLNVMRETEGAIIDKVADLFTIDRKGKVGYDYNKARRALDTGFSSSPDGGTNPLDIVRTLASAATRFIEKIVSVRNESGWKAQSERLAKVASSGDMKYEDFLKVVIQMVDLRDISSEIYIHTDKRVKGEADVTQNYNMFNNRDNGFDRIIAEVSQMRERFADSTDLTD